MNISLLTIKEVANKLKVHPQTVYAWVYNGKLKVTRISGILRIEETTLNELIKRGRNAKPKKKVKL